MSIAETFITHRVENQVPALGAYNAFLSDAALSEAVQREGGGWASRQLAEFGALAGGEMMELGFTANENKPRLHAFDCTGTRIDEVEFHPSYHRLMQLGMQHGTHAFAWRHAETPGAHVARAALFFMHYQAESGTCCPLTMTHAVVPALRRNAALSAQWLPRLTSLEYDPRSLPASEKTGCTMGMGMTEKQG
nr:DNA alkylation response protein [Pseudomonadota bacterium]